MREVLSRRRVHDTARPISPLADDRGINIHVHGTRDFDPREHDAFDYERRATDRRRDRRRDEDGEEELHEGGAGEFSERVIDRIADRVMERLDRRRDAEREEEEEREERRANDRRRDRRRARDVRHDSTCRCESCKGTRSIGDAPAAIGAGGSGRLSSRPDILKAIDDHWVKENAEVQRRLLGVR